MVAVRTPRAATSARPVETLDKTGTHPTAQPKHQQEGRIPARGRQEPRKQPGRSSPGSNPRFTHKPSTSNDVLPWVLDPGARPPKLYPSDRGGGEPRGKPHDQPAGGTKGSEQETKHVLPCGAERGRRRRGRIRTPGDQDSWGKDEDAVGRSKGPSLRHCEASWECGSPLPLSFPAGRVLRGGRARAASHVWTQSGSSAPALQVFTSPSAIPPRGEPLAAGSQL